MSKSTISTFQLFQLVPDAETGRLWFESRLWPTGVRCPVCGLGERITTRKGGFYRCNQCQEDFTVRTGTVMERSHIPLHKWVYAMYLVVTARKGISSMQLAKEIGVTQKTAWFVLGRLREACGGNDNTMLQGIVEVDETFVGGKAKNMHKNVRAKAMAAPDTFEGEKIVVGLIQRGGRVKAGVVPNRGKETLHYLVDRHVSPDAMVVTDEHHPYKGIKQCHVMVNHGEAEYARGDIHTNTIESVWAVLKRSINGTWHQVSPSSPW